jgi:hypothetical protein
MKISSLTVIYNNYQLLDYQRSQIKKLNINYDKHIIVDNTPLQYRNPIIPFENELIVYRDNTGGEFDGISHGEALDYGMKFVETDYVYVYDSDYFQLKNNQDEIQKMIQSGYLAIGTEFWNQDYLPHYKRMPEKFNNIPCCFGSYYSTNIIKDLSWVVTPQEVNHESGFIEVGWRIRKYILENNIKTFAFKCKSFSNNDDNFVYYDDQNNKIGLHVVGGSHRNSKNFEMILKQFDI